MTLQQLAQHVGHNIRYQAWPWLDNGDSWGVFTVTAITRETITICDYGENIQEEVVFIHLVNAEDHGNNEVKKVRYKNRGAFSRIKK